MLIRPSPSGGSSPTPPCCRLLLAEDDPDLRDVFRTVLEASGVLVVAVTDGRAALDQLRDDTDHFDVAILDVRMPLMTGLEVLRESTRMGVAVPTVLITSFGDAELHEQGRVLGAMDVVDKPVDADQLRQIVRDAVERSSKRNNSSTSTP